MAELRWIKTSLLLILVLQFTAAATGQLYLSFAVRDGDEVTFPCNNVLKDHKNCDTTTWLFIDSRSRATVELVKDGEIGETAKAKSDRLSVSENCSLVIKNVRDEDVGQYVCRQYRSGRQDGPDALVLLSVVTMTEHKDTDKVTLICSVLTYEECRHTVKWLLQGQDVDKDNKELKTSTSSCRASLMFLTSHYVYTSRYKTVKCEVTEGVKVKQFPFRIWPSGEKTGEDTTTTPTEDGMKAAKTTTTSTISDASPKIWWYVIVALVLVALLIITVAVIIWKRTKGNTTLTDGNADAGLTSSSQRVTKGSYEAPCVSKWNDNVL
ncbi:uncharacterized protein LOC129115296 [Anoplopoma fimbria]|uniref:uncharacterized protein LOC129115296 n=1 Tax=Anoplopoma fimbria TaxID=229290 RepID=UPI0023EDFC3F|nr:uncharacterized protein LOC129115296 [Anoplopoma fimbria]